MTASLATSVDGSGITGTTGLAKRVVVGHASSVISPFRILPNKSTTLLPRGKETCEITLVELPIAGSAVPTSTCTPN